MKMVLSNQKLQDSKWSKASKDACHTIDSLPENVKSTIRNLRIAVERMHLGLTKAKELIFETARQLDEEHVEERVKICKKIKEILKDKIQEGKISEGWIEECLPREYKRKYTRTESHRKIRVNAISPGVIETPMSAELSEQLKTILVSTTPLGRMGHPDEIAKAVAFLASDDSSYITGIELFVDGGLAQI
jgi:hypothetical protein